MTKEEKKEKKNKQIIEFETPSGIKVKMDLSKANTRLLINARTFSEGGFASVPYIISKICLFDGEELTPDELMDEIDMLDFTAIEAKWGEVKKLETSPSQTSTT